MAKRVYLYADETGNLDYEGTPNPRGGGASTYFGFGTAAFDTQHHGDDLLQGLHLRASCAKEGISLAKGFHAVDDSSRTRNEMFHLIQEQAPRFDTTFLMKANAYAGVRVDGPMRLYKLAWFLHLKQVALQVSRPEDELYVVVAEFGTKSTRRAASEAVADVCAQINRNITLCVDSAILMGATGRRLRSLGSATPSRRQEVLLV